MSINFTSQLLPPPTFDGKREHYEEWSFKMKSYLAVMDSEYIKGLTAVETNYDIVVDDDAFTTSSGTVNTAMKKQSDDFTVDSGCYNYRIGGYDLEKGSFRSYSQWLRIMASTLQQVQSTLKSSCYGQAFGNHRTQLHRAVL